MKTAITSLVLGGLLLAGAARADTEINPSIKLTAQERYDDDTLLRTDSGAGQLITKISPQVGVELKRHHLKATSWYALDLSFRHGNGTTAVDHRGSVEVKGETSERNTVEGKLGVWRVTDPTSLPRLGVAATLEPILYGKLELADEFKVSARWLLKPGYRFEGAQVYEPGRPAGSVHVPYLEAWFHATHRSDLGAEYRFQYFNFGPESDHANGLYGGYRYRITRLINLTAKVGPTFLQRHSDPARVLTVPRAMVELDRHTDVWDLAVVAGHDLVGASGFQAILWADFASLVTSVRLNPQLKVFGAASYFRNGHDLSSGLVAFTTNQGVSQGYAMGGGAEWRFNKVAAVQGTFDRISQVGGAGNGEADLVRDIAAVRLVITAL